MCVQMIGSGTWCVDYNDFFSNLQLFFLRTKKKWQREYGILIGQ